MLDQNNNMYRSSDDKFFAGVCSGMQEFVQVWRTSWALVNGVCVLHL